MNRVIEHGSPCQVMVDLGDDESMANFFSVDGRLVDHAIHRRAGRR